MKIRNDVRLGAILVLGDILVINAGFLFSYWIRFNSGLFKTVFGVPHVSRYFQVLPVLTVILIFLMRSDKLYSVRSRLSIVDEFFMIVKSVTVGILLFMAGTFLYREYSFSRGMLSVTWFVLIFFISGWRYLVNRARFALRKKDRNLLIIGDGQIVGNLIKHIAVDSHWDYNVKGVLRINSDVLGAVDSVPVLGRTDELCNVIKRHDIDEVILTDVEIPRTKIMEIILGCEKHMVEFRLTADLLVMVTSQVDMRTIDGVPLLGLKESPLAEGYNRFVKRAMDIVLSIIGVIVLSPVFIIIGILVKINSPGPIFYFQKRIGEDGNRFAMIKFRTMINNAEKGTGPVWTQADDPRRTKIGTFLRKTNLDELPQIINVLKGEMSLVGPRPERPHFVGKFKEDIPRYMARHRIKSGMTGWAQVNGLRGDTSIEERTKYDLYYIENWSLVFDLKILSMSLFALKNAY
ncbi:MAG: undecaprenyl-phosphate glucose phosphotransferase [Candidatus Omnitrophica bacterium]|nr:undecaprenyl-phosphate glucose phosphotransferase [Candidatus Omnitrophota bacterium]